MRIEIIKCDSCCKEIDDITKVLTGFTEDYKEICGECYEIQSSVYSIGATDARETDSLIRGSIYICSLLEGMDRDLAARMFGTSTLDLFDNLQKELKG